jgi:hypothetical protein
MVLKGSTANMLNEWIHRDVWICKCTLTGSCTALVSTNVSLNIVSLLIDGVFY